MGTLIFYIALCGNWLTEVTPNLLFPVRIGVGLLKRFVDQRQESTHSKCVQCEFESHQTDKNKITVRRPIRQSQCHERACSADSNSAEPI